MAVECVRGWEEKVVLTNKGAAILLKFNISGLCQTHTKVNLKKNVLVF